MTLHVKSSTPGTVYKEAQLFVQKGLSALLEYHFGKVIAIQVVYESVIELTKVKLLQVEEDENERAVLGQTEQR